MTPRATLFDGRDLVVLARDADPRGAPAARAVVSFSTWLSTPLGDAPAATASGFGEGAFVKRGADEILVIPRANHWYQTPEIGPALEAVRARLAGREGIAYGASMGGYAAVAFAPRLGLRCFALAAQFSIDRAVVPFERRWAAEAAAVTFDNDAIPRDGDRCEGVLFHDPLVRLDRLQAELILRHTRLRSAPCPFSGHSTPRHVNAVAGLADLAARFLDGSFELAAFRAQRRAGRAADPVYATNLVTRLLGSGRLEAARRAEARLLDLDALALRERMKLCLRYADIGDLDRAREIAEAAAETPRATAAEHILMATMWRRLGARDRAERVVAEGLERAPGNARLKALAELLAS